MPARSVRCCWPSSTFANIIRFAAWPLFGSVLREDLAVSDVDLLIKFEPGARVGFLALGRIQRELPAWSHRTLTTSVLYDMLWRGPQQATRLPWKDSTVFGV